MTGVTVSCKIEGNLIVQENHEIAKIKIVLLTIFRQTRPIGKFACEKLKPPTIVPCQG